MNPINVFTDVGSLILSLMVLGLWIAPGGVVYSQSRLYLLRNTEADKKIARYVAIPMGIFWFLTMWFLLAAKYSGSIDPITRQERQAVLEKERAERERARIRHETSLAEERAKQEQTALLEDLALRKRARLAGEDIPMTEEEIVALEAERARVERVQIENKAASVAVEDKQLALEGRKERMRKGDSYY